MTEELLALRCESSEKELYFLEFLQSDIGRNILRFIRIRDFKKLYIFFPCFYQLFNNIDFLQTLRYVRKVISPTATFPEFHLQYMMKFHLMESGLNFRMARDIAIQNDDPEMLDPWISYNDVLLEAFKLNKKNILASGKDRYTYFMFGYAGTYEYGTDSTAAYSSARMHCYQKRAFFSGAMLREEQSDSEHRDYMKLFKYLGRDLKWNPGFFVTLFLNHIVSSHSYEECLTLLKKVRDVTNIRTRKIEGEFLIALVELGKRDYFIRAIKEEFVSKRRFRNVLTNDFIHLSKIGVDMLDLVGLRESDLPQFSEGTLVKLFCFDAFKNCHKNYCVYTHSLLGLITELYIRNPNLKVSSLVHAQMKASRDVLTLKYIADNGLLLEN